MCSLIQNAKFSANKVIKIEFDRIINKQNIKAKIKQKTFCVSSLLKIICVCQDYLPVKWLVLYTL